MPSADELLIRVRLTGARTAAAEAKVVAGSIDEIGAAQKRTAGSAATLATRMNRTGERLTATGHSMSRAFTVPFALIAGGSAKLAIDFQKDMEMIHTQAGAAQREVGLMSDFILHHMKNAVQGPDELAKALFRIESIGLRGKKAMAALTEASNLAMVGGANVEDTAKTIGQVIFTGIKGLGPATGVAAKLNATIGAGDMRLQQLVDALGTNVTASAKQAGLSFQDLTGALAIFGDSTNNVSGLTAQFATALHFLYNPTNKASAAMEAMHLPSDQLAKDMSKPNGLVRALKDLRSHLEALPGGPRGVKGRQLLGDILPGGRGRVILQLLNQLDRLQQKEKQIAGTTGAFPGAVKTSQQLAANRLSAAWAAIQRQGVIIGGSLLPMLVPVVTKVASAVEKLAHWFNALPKGTQRTIVKVAAFMALAGPLAIFVGSTVRGLASIAGGLRGLAKGALWAGEKIVQYVTGGTGIGGLKAAAGGPLSRFGGFLRARLGGMGKIGGRVMGGAILTGLSAYLASHTPNLSGSWFEKLILPLAPKGDTPFHPAKPPPGHHIQLGGGPGGQAVIVPNTTPRGPGHTSGKPRTRAHPHRRMVVAPSGVAMVGAGDDSVIEMHNHLYLDSKEIFTSVDRQMRNRRNRGG